MFQFKEQTGVKLTLQVPNSYMDCPCNLRKERLGYFLIYFCIFMIFNEYLLKAFAVGVKTRNFARICFL